MATRSKHTVSLKQVIKALKGYKKKGWKITTFELSREVVEEPSNPEALFYWKCWKPGPDINITFRLTNPDSSK